MSVSSGNHACLIIPIPDSAMKVNHIAACPACHSNMGIVSDPTTDWEEVSINNVQMTAHVSEIPCASCETTVFRIQRRISLRFER